MGVYRRPGRVSEPEVIHEAQSGEALKWLAGAYVVFLIFIIASEYMAQVR